MKRAWIGVLALVLLVAAGCGPAPQSTDSTSPFIGGLGGLAASFAPGMPPAETFDAGQGYFSVGVMLENLGESSVGINSQNTYGYVELIGINPAQFGALSGQAQLRKSFSEAQLELGGARRGYEGTVVPGEISLLEFSDLSYQPDRFGNEEVTIRANICYEYRTFSDTDLCFKDNVLENALDDTICTLTGAKTVSNSGAPIQVTQVTQNPAGSNKIQVTFVVENLGPGLVFAPWSYQTQFGTSSFDDACQFNVGANPNRDVVFAEVSLGSGYSSGTYNIECPIFGRSSAGVVRMFGGAPATVTCTIETFGTQGSRIFTDSLHIDLWYTYFDFIETPILIRDTNLGFVERTSTRG